MWIHFWDIHNQWFQYHRSTWYIDCVMTSRYSPYMYYVVHIFQAQWNNANYLDWPYVLSMSMIASYWRWNRSFRSKVTATRSPYLGCYDQSHSIWMYRSSLISAVWGAIQIRLGRFGFSLAPNRLTIRLWRSRSSIHFSTTKNLKQKIEI